jgi:energy-coupling factor transport system ATP-binding protein
MPEPPIPEPLIECRDVHHTYLAGTPMQAAALHGVTLRIEAGECVGVLGPTGSGKSTLMQHLNALLRPTAGWVRIAGADLWAPHADRRRARQRVGLVFQFPEYQLFEETVRGDVAYGPRNLGLGEDAVAERVDDALRAVGLAPERFADRSPFGLSGGEMRRVALAGVLAMRPQVLVLDEPTAGLDPRGKEELLDRIAALHRGGLTVIVVTHTMDEVARLARRVVVMFDGRIVFDGPTPDAFARAGDLRRWGLALPQAAQLVQRLRERGVDVGEAMTPAEARRAIAAAWRRRGAR